MIFSTESSDWHIVHQETNAMLAELLKNEVESNDIPCYLVNRTDSSYPIFGRYVLYVPRDQYEVAKVVVDLFLEKRND
jgi:hypothetical protein